MEGQRMALSTDLNQAWVDRHQCSDEDGYHGPVDNSASSELARVRAIFRNLDQELISMIREAEVVVGCVAWLTHHGILHELSEVPGGVSIVVQKEDFLRPDSRSSRNIHAQLRSDYRKLKGFGERWCLGGVVSVLSLLSDQTVEPVRCVGNHNADKAPSCPRMHNKFLVFCNKARRSTNGNELGDAWSLAPMAVWTGSLNLTFNATVSLENAVVIDCPRIASAYLDEWRQILAISEPLDWESKWCEPQWRLGT